jgi:hypothetical protein
MADVERVEQFDVLSRHVRPEDMRDAVLVSSDLGQHAAWLREILDLDVDEVFVHHVPKEQSAFIDAFGTKVLPEVAR